MQLPHLKFPRVPNLVGVSTVEDCINYTVKEFAPDQFGPERPDPFFPWTARFKCAWLVFIGRADALVWPGNQ